MKNKLWRVPLISVVTGTISLQTSLMVVRIISKGTSEWTLGMGTTMFWVHIIVALVLFITSGTLFLRDMTMKEIFKSALIVSTYFAMVVVIEQLLWANGHYPTILFLLFMPVGVYNVLHSTLLQTTNLNVFITVTLSIFTPLLYVLFGIRRKAKTKKPANTIAKGKA